MICIFCGIAVAEGNELEQVLLDGGAESTRDYALNLPVHYALLTGGDDGVECVRILASSAALGDQTASLSLASPEALSRELGNAEATRLLAPDASAEVKALGAPALKTMLLYSEGCLAHAASSDYGPESASRLHVLISEGAGALRSGEFKDKVLWKHVTKKAPIADVIRVHEYNYVAWLLEQCEKLRKEEQAAASEAAAAADPSAPDSSTRKSKKEEVHKRLDLDTVITAASYDAAFLAAGAVIEAVDAVLEGKAANAFCVTRPAGHHAGPRGAAKTMMEVGKEGESHGFCLLSNAAIGAAYAMAARGRDKGVSRVAIVDFDVHHGNGTEEVVRNLRPSTCSHTHSSPMGDVTVTSRSFKPWVTDLDED
jgi:acetoin utilization deacetylase AcuC-like enzyme